MSEHDHPIVLPGLAAHRREPSAAVCPNGHVLAWLVEPDVPVGYCPQCGGEVLFACPACHAVLPPDGEMLKWVPYHTHCSSCGKPYPWIAADVERAKRTLAEQAQVEKRSDDVSARANALVDDIIADRAAPSEVVATVKWLEHSEAESAASTILETVERLGSVNLKQALRPSFPGLF